MGKRTDFSRLARKLLVDRLRRESEGGLTPVAIYMCGFCGGVSLKTCRVPLIIWIVVALSGPAQAAAQGWASLMDAEARWLNGSIDSLFEIRGKVTLVVFWTLGCCYCMNTLPYVKSWHERYADRGLSIIGVHSPEYVYYASEALVSEQLRRLGCEFPVLLDHRLTTWRRFSCRSWPTLVLLGRVGEIRKRFEWPIRFEVVDKEIRDLLEE